MENEILNKLTTIEELLKRIAEALERIELDGITSHCRQIKEYD